MSRTGLWDSHAHLDSDYFTDDREELIAKLQEDLDGIVNPGCDGPTSAFAVELAEKYDFIYAAVGWHPEELKGIPADYLEQLAAWAVHPKVVAIGEIGLDYYWKENEPKEVQQRIFLEQIDLAKQFDLPIIIHDRDAHGDMLELFQKEVKGVQAVFHCFSGSLEMAKELAKRGYYFGFGGTSTYKNNQKTREVMQYVPKELLLFETDSPYLSPVPFRGKRNNPGYVEYTARHAAELLGMDFAELAALTAANTKRLFKKIK
ncbi:TatD family hydrolase [Phascolarctobacterium sp.]|uniref:TatD family hydrolase n=1 Tax=Phascolarctobacterium sp. TaxID=2049039 RepID=UPI0038704347